MRILITGGVKSGKSRYALDHARTDFPATKIFIATSAVLDEEMAARIEKHQAERKRADGSEDFITIEEQLRIDLALGGAEAHASASEGYGVLLDCLPMWVNNLMHYEREADFDAILDASIALFPAHTIVVTNETGLGNIPFDAYTRRYNILLAEANRRVAAAFDSVVMLVSGLPLRLK